jgi:hypothetical protein
MGDAVMSMHLTARQACLAVGFAGGLMLAGPAAAQTATEWGAVQQIEAGWAEDTMAVWHSAPIVNPDGCRVTSAGYATSPADAGHSLFHTVIMSAWLNRKEVMLRVAGCVYDKPRILSVSVR